MTGELFLASLGYYTATIIELYVMNALGHYLVESNTPAAFLILPLNLSDSFLIANSGDQHWPH